jgi:hypothetical protein
MAWQRSEKVVWSTALHEVPHPYEQGRYGDLFYQITRDKWGDYRVDQVIVGKTPSLTTVIELVRYTPKLSEARAIARAAMRARWDW